MPHITLLSTGGTIAMRSQDGAGGQVALGARDHLAVIRAAMPGLEITAIDVLAKPSASFAISDLAAIAGAVKKARATTDGVIVTHGTDTLEETAFALELALPRGAPVVLTGSMRRGDEPGADGPANLVAAARVAAHPASRDLGVLVAIDDEIHWGPLVRKAHAFRVHAFSSAPFGPIGWIAEGEPKYVLRPVLALPEVGFGLELARVPILECGPGVEPAHVDALAEVSDGMVLSLPGAGHVDAAAVEALARAAVTLPVVFASRTGAGQTLRGAYGFAGSERDLLARGLIGAGMLDARKARILLMMRLSQGADRGVIAGDFAALGGG